MNKERTAHEMCSTCGKEFSVTNPDCKYSSLHEVNSGVINEVTEKYWGWEEAVKRYSALVEPYIKARNEAEKSLQDFCKSHPFDVATHPYWEEYVRVAHLRGYNIWGID